MNSRIGSEQWGEKRQKCPENAARRTLWKQAPGSLLSRRSNIYSGSPGDVPLRLLSSHSALLLMLHFQNFHITKGPTTSAEKYPCKYKIRAPAPSVQREPAFRRFQERERRDFGYFYWGFFFLGGGTFEDFFIFAVILTQPASLYRRGNKEGFFGGEKAQCQRPSLDLSTTQR